MALRYLTARSREQLVVSRVVASMGLGILGFIGFLWSQDPHATLFQAAPFGLVGIALLVGAQVYARRHRQYLRVDLDARQAVFVSRGKEQWSESLDELGPVVCLPFERRRQRNGVAYDLTEYQTALAGRKNLAVQQSGGYPASRRFAFRLAREWGVGFRGLDGRVRKASDLDQPLKRNRERAAPLAPESGVAVKEDEGITTLQSKVLPRSSGVPELHLILVVAFAWAGLSERHADQVFLDPFFKPVETLLLGALALAGAGAALVFLLQVWRFMQPAALTVTAEEVRYRGRSMRIADIREVVSAGDILILGNGRHLAIPSDFCQPAATGAVIQALHQIIADRTTATPSAGG